VGQTWNEAELFRSYWDDGLLDLLAGSALLVTGVGWAIGLGPLAVIQAPLWVALWIPLRGRLVEPRAGYVEFSRCRQADTRRAMRQALGDGVRALAAVALLVYLVRQGGGASLREVIPGLPAVLVAAAAVVAGALTSARRFHWYAVVLVLGAVAAVVLHLGPAAPLVVASLVVIGTGLVMIVRFVRGSREFLDGD